MGFVLPRNPLIFPGGWAAAGINPAHVASGFVQFSGVARGGSFQRLDRSAVATLTGTPAASIDGLIGPAVSFSSTQTVAFAGNGTALTNGLTLAAIVRCQSAFSATSYVVSDSNLNVLEINSSGAVVVLANNAATFTTTFTLSASHAYFLVAAIAGLAGTALPVYVFALDLQTGKILSQSGTLNVTQAAGATVYVGNRATGASPFPGKTAAAAILHNGLSRAAVQEWASAPWDFWYPPSALQTIFASLAGERAVYSLAAAQGAYTLTGNAQAFAAWRGMAAAEGTYALVGETSTSIKAHGLAASQGAYNVAGEIAVLRQTAMGAATGSFALNGRAATLAVGLGATQGAYALTGEAAVLAPTGLSLRAQTGFYTLAGFSPAGGAGSGPPFAGRHSMEFIADVGRITVIADLTSLSGGAPSSTWSTADASANGMTLSNGNMTADYTGAANWVSIRTSTSQTSGKLYIEFTLSGATSDLLLFGLASSGFNVASNLGSSNYSCGYFPDATLIYVSTGFTSQITPSGTPVSGDVWALAVDFGAGNIWLAQNNVWLAGSPNPATGTTPSITFVPATVGALFAAMSFHSSGSGSWTLQPTAASQTYAPPSGFTPWG